MELRFWSGYVLSVVGMVLCSWNMSFNTFALSLKKTFNLTQSQVELVTDMSNIGAVLCLSEPLISVKFGYTASYIFGWTLSVTSCSLFFLAVRYKLFFSQKSWLLGVFQLMAAMGTNVMDLVLIGIGINNFGREHTGKLIGIYTAASAFGKIFYGSLIELFFEDEFLGFFRAVSVMWSVVFGACVLLHRRLYLPDPDLQQANEQLEDETSEHQEDTELITTKNMLTNLHFNLIVWPTALLNAGALTYMHNVTSMGGSAGMDSPQHLVYTLSITLITGRTLLEILFDRLKTNQGRSRLMIVCPLPFIVAMIILLAHFNATMLYVATVLVGITLTVSFSIPLNILLRRFGRQRYGLLFGLMKIIGPLFVIPLQMIIGFLYDSEASLQHSAHFCAGKPCFHLTCFILLGYVVLANVLQVINYSLENKQLKR